MNKMYRIKHIPTGLYYQPKKGRWNNNKTHFHVGGKVYHRKPKIQDIGHYLVISDRLNKLYNIGTKSSYDTNIVHFKPSDWIIEEI